MSEDWIKEFDYKFTTFGQGKYLKQAIKSDDVKDFIKNLLIYFYECPTCRYRISNVEWETIKSSEAQRCPRCQGLFTEFKMLRP